jgi:hypothetical protein
MCYVIYRTAVSSEFSGRNPVTVDILTAPESNSGWESKFWDQVNYQDMC